jgi:tetratricopeptide (TPR) repeat protein
VRVMVYAKLRSSSLILICLAAGLLQSQEAKVEPITSALRARDFDRAIELSRAALKQSPNNAQLWSLQGIALASKGENKSALEAFQQALKISPDYIAALAGAAQIHYQAGDLKAVPLLNHLLELRPGEPTSHAMLGVLEYRQGHCAAAASHFEKSGSLLDSQLDALHAWATCLVRLKRVDAAETIFQRVVTLHPDDPRERQLLASIQLMAHKPQDSLATLAPVLQASDPDPGSLELASTAYEESGDTSHAVSALRQAILLEPQNVNLYLDFANLSMAHQSFQVGINVINDGINLQPDASKLYLARGVLYVQLADYDKAEADFEKAHELDPNQSLSSAAQGLAALQQNDIDRALATVQAKLARKPNDAYLLYLQADFLSQKGANPGTPEFDKAMRSARKAVALQPALAGARGVLAKLYLQAGKNQEAVEQCRKAIESDPKDQTAVYRLIQALRKTNDKAEIPDLLKKLASLREQAAKEERERYRYKLVETDTPSGQPNQP